MLGEGASHLVQLVRAEVRQEFLQGAHELARGAHPLVETDQTGGEVAAAAEDHPGTAPVGQEPVGAARVLDGLGRHAQRDQLVGLGGPDGGGHDAEGGDVYVGEVVDEAASCGSRRGRRGARRPGRSGGRPSGQPGPR